MLIVWDEPKRLVNIAKHGLDFGELTAEFFLGAAILPASLDRSKAVNVHKGQAVTAVFKPLGGEAVSVISLRPAGRVERRALK